MVGEQLEPTVGRWELAVIQTHRACYISVLYKKVAEKGNGKRMTNKEVIVK